MLVEAWRLSRAGGAAETASGASRSMRLAFMVTILFCAKTVGKGETERWEVIGAKCIRRRTYALVLKYYLIWGWRRGRGMNPLCSIPTMIINSPFRSALPMTSKTCHSADRN